jgi:hypothetical protein
MQSVKCDNCGLVNWNEDLVCKRCGFILSKRTQPLSQKPPVVKWFGVYSAFMSLLYLLCIVAGIFFFIAEPSDARRSAEEARFTGIALFIVGLLLFFPFAAGPFLPRKGWAWTFGLVLIGIGLTSICCLPATIPLLIFWLKPETKTYFGKV